MAHKGRRLSCVLTYLISTRVAGKSLRTSAGIGAGSRHAGGTVLALVLVAGIGWHFAGGAAPPVLTLAKEVSRPVLTHPVTAARVGETLVDSCGRNG